MVKTAEQKVCARYAGQLKQAMSTFATAEALRIVLREEQPAAMAEVLLDMERARMTAEDYRGAILQNDETSEDDETSGGATSDDDDHETQCIVCRTVSSQGWWNIVPVGDVAPETVCDSCYAANSAMGEVDSCF